MKNYLRLFTLLTVLTIASAGWSETINLRSGDNGEVKISKDAPVMFYDDGGADGKQSTSFTGSITFAPADEGYGIRLTFKQWGVSGNDYLYIYNGGALKTAADLEMGMYTNTPDQLGGVYSSKSDDGKITLKYVTKSYAADGFAIEVSAYKREPLAITGIQTAAIAPENVLRGQGDVEMLRVQVNVTGDYTPLTVSSFRFDADASSALAVAHLYATDTITAFGTLHEYGQTTGASLTIDGAYTIREAGSYFFWLTYDVATDGATGSQLSAKLTNLSTTQQLTPTTAPTATTTLRDGLHGTFTVGDDGNWFTIQQAVNALAEGVDGPVVINVKKGEYNERVAVPHIPGASAVNTITLQSESGNYEDVHLYHDAYTYLGYSDDQMAKAYGVITFDNVDWFTLRGIEVSTTDKMYDGVVYVKNQSRHLTIEDCYLHAPMSTDIQFDINIIGHYAPNIAHHNNDYLTVRNNLIEGGYHGVNMGGTQYVALPKEVGGIIEGNTLRNQGFKAIYCYDELGAKIRYNRIENDATDKTNAQGAIDLTQRETYTESLVVEGNTFLLSPKAYTSAIYLRDIYGTAAAPAYIMNNEIIVDQMSTSSCGIKLSRGTVDHLHITGNSILMKDGSGPALWFATAVSATAETKVDVSNNVMQSTSGNLLINLYTPNNVGRIAFSNNVLHTTGPTLAQSNYANQYTSFDAWAEAVGETGSYGKQVSFLSDNTLEPATDLDGDLLKGKALDWLTTDIRRKPRAAVPTIGAYEFAAADVLLSMTEGFPKVTVITDSSAVVQLQADGNGDAHLVVQQADLAAPTAEAILQSGQTTAISALHTVKATVNNLQKDEEYIGYVVLENLHGKLSEVYATERFVASSVPTVPTPPLTLTTNDLTLPLGQTATLRATLTGGKTPYTVTWLNAHRDTLCQETLDKLPTEELTLDITPAECTDYLITVSDAREVTASDTARVVVTGENVAATFENLFLEEESFWDGRRADGADVITSFVNGTYRLGTQNTYHGLLWSGFGYASRTGKDYESINDQWNSAPGGGYKGSKHYGVFYYSTYSSPSTIDVLHNEEGDTIRGFYITNNAYAFSSMTNGDDIAKKFAKGDWFKVTAKADNGNEAEYYLADFRSDNAADHYVLDTWEWFDLRSLGKVKSVAFTLTSSDNGTYGMNTPAYFCLDNLGGDIAWREGATLITRSLTMNISIGGMTNLRYPGATTKWEILNELPDGVTATLTDEGKLTLSATTAASFDMYVKVSQRGRSQYIHFPISIATGINSLTPDPSPRGEGSVYYTLDGVRVDVDGSNLPTQKGIYIHNGKKFIIK